MGRVSSLSGPASARGGLLFSRRQRHTGQKQAVQLGKERIHWDIYSGSHEDSASLPREWSDSVGQICTGV